MKQKLPNNPRRVKLTKADREQVFRTYGRRCWLCGKPGADTCDHVKPVKAGGTNLLGNLRPSHKVCNSRRGAPLPIEGRYR